MLRPTVLDCVATFILVHLIVAQEPVCEVGSDCAATARDQAEASGAHDLPEQYYWAKRGRNALGNSASPHVGPSDFSTGPAWVWDNSEDELVRHGPSIDGEGNVYLATSFGWVRKFSPNGEVLWSWRTSREEGLIRTCIVLYEGRIFFVSTSTSLAPALAFSLDMRSGQVLWRAPLPVSHMHEDSHTIFVHRGILLAPCVDEATEANVERNNNKIVAVSASDGSFLWEHSIDGIVWNWMPATPGDDSFLFATTAARAHRVNLTTGRLIWKAGFPDTGRGVSTGGGTLGPNGIFYAVGSYFNQTGRGQPFPDVADCSPVGGCEEGAGILLGYRVADGEVVLKKRLKQPGNQYPAVGMLGPRLAVVVAIGQNPALMSHFLKDSWLPLPVKIAIHMAQLRFWPLRRMLGIPVLQGSVHAFDAVTGHELWSFEDEPFDYFAGAGDEHDLGRRVQRSMQEPNHTETICGPDSWGIPVIAGDGTVYASSGTNGNLYAIRDGDGDGVIASGEVSTFRTSQAFLNAPALAPGMLVAAPCWGPMYVFKGER